MSSLSDERPPVLRPFFSMFYMKELTGHFIPDHPVVCSIFYFIFMSPSFLQKRVMVRSWDCHVEKISSSEFEEELISFAIL